MQTHTIDHGASPPLKGLGHASPLLEPWEERKPLRPKGDGALQHQKGRSLESMPAISLGGASAPAEPTKATDESEPHLHAALLASKLDRGVLHKLECLVQKRPGD